MLPIKFQVNWPSVQEKKRKIDFQEGRHWISHQNDFSFFFFYLQVTPILPTKFQVNWPFGSGEEDKKDFQAGGHGGHLWFRIRMILAIFDLLVTPMPHTKFRVNLFNGSEGVVENSKS